MSRYSISENDIKYANEFKKNLYENNHYHSPGLQRILNLFRSGPKKNKYVLLVGNNNKSWHLGCFPENRGQKIRKYSKINLKTTKCVSRNMLERWFNSFYDNVS